MISTGFEVTVYFPFRLAVLPNLHIGKWQLASVVAETRRVVGLELLAQALQFRQQWRVMAANPAYLLRVLQERSGPQALDDDNLTGSFKPVRDEIAAFFEIDDGRRDRWVWLPCQQQIGSYTVRLHIEVVKLELEEFQGIKPLQKTKKTKLRISPNVKRPK